MSCQHLNELTLETMISKANYPVFRCEECLRVGDRWVHLRICQTCGKMLCCDSSKNQALLNPGMNRKISPRLGENSAKRRS